MWGGGDQDRGGDRVESPEVGRVNRVGAGEAPGSEDLGHVGREIRWAAENRDSHVDLSTVVLGSRYAGGPDQRRRERRAYPRHGRRLPSVPVSVGKDLVQIKPLEQRDLLEDLHHLVLLLVHPSSLRARVPVGGGPRAPAPRGPASPVAQVDDTGRRALQGGWA